MSKRILWTKNDFFIFNKQAQNIRNYGQKPTMPECGFRPKKYKEMSYDEMMDIQRKYMPQKMPSHFKKPLVLVQGYMQWLFDIEGKRYLDMFGGVAVISVGHCNPIVIKRVKKQMSCLGHVSNNYAYPLKYAYISKLVEKLPGDLKVVYFVNSGSEASDLALLLARTYTQKTEIITLHKGYHGATDVILGMSGVADSKYPVSSPSGTNLTMGPDVFRGPWGGSHCTSCKIKSLRPCCCAPNECIAKDKYLEQLSNLINISLAKNSLAAFIVEPIQGYGGIIQFPKGYLDGAYEMVKKHGGLFICDEVQTSFGRLGDHFWGFQENNFIPDIITLAKGIANGIPFAAVVTTPEVAKAFQKATVIHTYGANSISCCAALATLEIIEKYNYQQNCKILGEYLLDRLAELRCKYKIIGDIRGKGFMIGIEMITGQKNNIDPLPENEFVKIWENCKNMGLIVGRGGLNGNVFRILPPMCITKEDVDFACDVLDEALLMYTSDEK